MALPVGHNVAKEIRWSVDPGQAAKRPAGASGLAPPEAATVVTGDVVARHLSLGSVTRYSETQVHFFTF